MTGAKNSTFLIKKVKEMQEERAENVPVQNRQAQQGNRRQSNAGAAAFHDQNNINIQPEAAPAPLPHGVHSNNYNWQASRTTIKDRITFMFNNETLSDVHFILGKGTERRRIPAHKFVLSVGSVVFDAMFNGGFGEQCNVSEIEIPDIEPAAFLSMLRFLYSDEVQIGPDTVMSTLYAAKKYAVPTLEAACVDFLKTNLGADNAFTLLSQARLFDEPQLAEMCLTCIDKNTVDALNAEGFTDIDSQTLGAVLQRDSLGARESQLFEAVVRWAEHECRRQEIPLSSENKR